MNSKRKIALFIMGVSGAGKSTVGKLLAQEMTLPFFDGDDYHPKKNKVKMSKGEALSDDDRQEWLEQLNLLAHEQLKSTSCVIACSALKESYREILKHNISSDVKFIFLKGTKDQIIDRMKTRKNHFMPPSLLASQFDTLESPVGAIQVDIKNTPKKLVKEILIELKYKSEFGLIGLGVMGKSLSRNLALKGFKLSMYNRHVDGEEENIAANFKNEHTELAHSKAFDNLKLFVKSLQRPRKILLMVNAGQAVDAVINSLLPHLSEHDTIVDGGNSHFIDTKRRLYFLKEKGLYFLGLGVSGGEQGALEGPSLMPGGSLNAYKMLGPYLEKIAAKDKQGFPCCSYISKDGSGHYVKMVHNGIEYAEMQLLAEIYFILKKSGRQPDQIAQFLALWKNKSNSYLLEITLKILIKKEGASFLIDKILDKSGNKGTGNWTTINTANLGVASTMIPVALFARYLSAFKDERIAMSKTYTQSLESLKIEDNDLLEAYQLARIINHFQGFKLLYEASKTYDWQLNLAEIARLWTKGCIIRSDLMVSLTEVLKNEPHILMADYFIEQVKKMRPALNKISASCMLHGLATPCLTEAATFLNGYTEANSSANLIQAQRDFFGAHTYERIDKPQGEFYHTNWEDPEA